MSHQVAKEVVSYCPSCKMDLAHVIVALDNQRIVRVICLTCKKEHAYHRPLEERDDKPPRVRKGKPEARKKPDPTPSAKWAELQEDQRESRSKAYSIQGRFFSGDKVQHAKFGTGFVMRVIPPGKMEVLFESGRKLLACGSA